MKTVEIYFRTREEADAKFHEFKNRPDVSSHPPYPIKLVDTSTGEKYDGWGISVRSWSLD